MFDYNIMYYNMSTVIPYLQLKYVYLRIYHSVAVLDSRVTIKFLVAKLGLALLSALHFQQLR